MSPGTPPSLRCGDPTSQRLQVIGVYTNPESGKNPMWGWLASEEAGTFNIIVA
jgi:hypothetical protein